MERGRVGGREGGEGGQNIEDNKQCILMLLNNNNDY